MNPTLLLFTVLMGLALCLSNSLGAATESAYSSESSLWTLAKKTLRYVFVGYSTPAEVKQIDEIVALPNETAAVIEEPINFPAVIPNTPEITPESIALSNAKRLIQEGQYNQSIDDLALVIEKNPENAEAHGLLGAVLLALNQLTLAEDVLYNAVKLSNWTDIVSISNLAEVLRISGDLELSEKIALKGLNVSAAANADAGLRFTLGAIYFAQKKYSLAADWYLTSALASPKNIDAWIRASTIDFPAESRDLKFAENVLLQGIQNNPENAELLFKLGTALHFGNKVDEAIPLYEAAIGLNGALSDAKASLATALHSVGRLQEALDYYSIAEKESPNNIILLCNYAILLCDAGYFKEGAVFVGRANNLNSMSLQVMKAATACKMMG